MKPAFRLDQHPRRAQPLLSEPPAGYFDQLPRRVMDRLPQPAGSPGSPATSWRWLLALPPAWRTGLASSALLVGFAASFWLSAPVQTALNPAGLASLDAVPQPELVNYLLTHEAQVEAADLADLGAVNAQLTNEMLRASDAEIRAALDGQPPEEAVLL